MLKKGDKGYIIFSLQLTVNSYEILLTCNCPQGEVTCNYFQNLTHLTLFCILSS